MTRCRKHQADVSSNIGVCASCLRERLIPLLAIQSPPLIFPRSVSPRVHPPPPPLFFTTPQLHKPTNTTTTTNSNINSSSYNKSTTKFSLLPKFLRSNSSSSSTWISTFFSKKSTSTSEAEIPCRRRGRGMSPARVSDCGGDDEYDDGGGESARGTPARRNRRNGGGSQNVTTAFCLSPLVRPSPKRRLEAGMMMMPQSLGAAAGSCANRSRKMADFGRLQRRP